ncbi:tRNA dihydrouridine synthase DusB [Xanthobacter sp. KR7-225]|uniref:tRNA dihydrouridine synthase DusB n=1 Tax=Xanthobacter sp. KR7-225 TaxID=3156613 RepID=UPI0032B42E16
MQDRHDFSTPALRIGPHELPSNVILAPMAGITDAPFRRMAVRYGAGLAVSEMVASAALMEGRPEMVLKAEGRGVGLHAVQLAGNDPYWMGEAARLAEAAGAAIVDINMGCPSKRVITGAAGAALLRDLPLARRIIAAVRKAVRIPVTLKTRLGWDEDAPTAVTLARMAEAEGVGMVTVHGRTRCQFYGGRADWAAIGAVKAALAIPVVANGDVTRPAHAPAIRAASRADAVMIGRGAQGRPWFPGQAARALAGRPVPPDPSIAEQRDVLLELYEGWLGHYGTELGVRQARKHIGWALEAAGQDAEGQGSEASKGAGGGAGFVARWRRPLLTQDDPAKVAAGIRAAYDELDRRAAA